MSKSVSLVVTLLALIAFGSLASAQTIDTSCATTLSGGSGNFSYTYCVSQHGNVVQMDTPTTPNGVPTPSCHTPERRLRPL